MTVKIPPPLQAFFWALIIWGLYKAVPSVRFDMPAQTALAVLFMCVGVTLDLVSVFNFFKEKTTVNPLKPAKASKLVVSGFYKISRNPMYLGMAFILTAWGLYLGTPLALIGLIGFVSVMNMIQIKPEEKALDAKFGADYLAYKNSVRRWI